MITVDQATGLVTCTTCRKTRLLPNHNRRKHWIAIHRRGCTPWDHDKRGPKPEPRKLRPIPPGAWTAAELLIVATCTDLDDAHEQLPHRTRDAIKRRRQRLAREGVEVAPLHEPVTACKYGHPYTPENTYIAPSSTSRRCIECIRIRNRSTSHKKAA